MPRERGATPRRMVQLALALAAARVVVHLILRWSYGGFTFLMSPTEIERTRIALEFSVHPAFSPSRIVYWVPLQFWVEGLALRFWRDALLIPFVVNTAASALTVAGVVLWTFELAGEGAALAAGLGVLFSATGIVLGAGGAADPLLHAAVVWALYFWARFEHFGRVRQAWLCAACLALGCAARFEAWLVCAALTSAALLERRRAAALPLAAAWLFPASWMVYCTAVAGAPWAFLSQTLDAEIRNLARSRWQLSLAFLDDFLGAVPAWVLALAVAGPPVDKRGLPRSYWLAFGAVALFFVGGHFFLLSQVDEHQWTVYLLALPAAGAAAAGWLSERGSRRRYAAAAACALFLAAECVHFRIYANYYENRLAPIVSVYMRVRELRRQGDLAVSDAVLIELPEGPRRGINSYRLWKLEPWMNGLYDRTLTVDIRAGRLEAPDVSVLDSGPAALAAWLKERRVRVVVASQYVAALSALGWVREDVVWFAPGDPLARRWER